MVGTPKPQKSKRAHHFNPVFNLAKFTNTGNKDGFLHVHDLTVDEEPRESSPAGCGYVNDLYKVVEAGLHVSEVEDWLMAEQDTPTSVVIAEMIRLRKLPTVGSLAFHQLMRYLSFAGVRTPAFREVVESWQNEGGGEMRANEFIRQMMDNAKYIKKHLSPRKWRLWVSEGVSGEFITSDQPLTMIKFSDRTHKQGEALKDQDVAVFFALSPMMVIEGRGRDGCTGTSNADPITVAVINGAIGVQAHRELYSRSRGISWANPGMSPQIMGSKDLITEWRRRNRGTDL